MAELLLSKCVMFLKLRTKQIFHIYRGMIPLLIGAKKQSESRQLLPWATILTYISQIDVQCNMVGFFAVGHPFQCYLERP